jgi:hypothetical protein
MRFHVCFKKFEDLREAHPVIARQESEETSHPAVALSPRLSLPCPELRLQKQQQPSRQISDVAKSEDLPGKSRTVVYQTANVKRRSARTKFENRP